MIIFGKRKFDDFIIIVLAIDQIVGTFNQPTSFWSIAHRVTTQATRQITNDQLNYATFASLIALITNLTDSMRSPYTMKITLVRSRWKLALVDKFLAKHAYLIVCICKKLALIETDQPIKSKAE